MVVLDVPRGGALQGGFRYPAGEHAPPLGSKEGDWSAKERARSGMTLSLPGARSVSPVDQWDGDRVVLR